jgi:shikimate dehydrogenase
MMKTKLIKAGVMGWPVAHSRSPIIHNYWIKQYKLHGSYEHLAVAPENLEKAINNLRLEGYAGCNITIPHKVNALSYMDWVDPLAQRIGAINTIVVQANGALHGFNHDGFGYIESLRETSPNWAANSGPAVVLGAGGASRAIIVGLLDAGATEIRLLNRTRSKADALAQEFGPAVTALDWHLRREALANASLLVNTTSQGMQGQAPLEIDLSELPTTALVSDAIYIPLETPLLSAARQRGNPTINGLGMLLHQARPAFKAWFEVMPQVTQDLVKNITATF